MTLTLPVVVDFLPVRDTPQRPNVERTSENGRPRDQSNILCEFGISTSEPLQGSDDSPPLTEEERRNGEVQEV